MGDGGGLMALAGVGNVGGQKIVLVSAATTDDAGKTVNITPFTDLIIANLAGTTATTSSPAPASICVASISAFTPDEVTAMRSTSTLPCRALA